MTDDLAPSAASQQLPITADEKEQMCVRLAHERSLGVGPDLEFLEFRMLESPNSSRKYAYANRLIRSQDHDERTKGIAILEEIAPITVLQRFQKTSEDVSQEKVLLQLSKGYYWDGAYVRARQTLSRLMALYQYPAVASRDVDAFYAVCTDKVLESAAIGAGLVTGAGLVIGAGILLLRYAFKK
mmetsp:Transcript_17970/g.45692  ORF Transcript_17970/g.45692 Transcript_17970/m.45692 type:complete len:184 (-) Transcript_17970:53-604(-)|eukprot:CAMPEP_0177639918 /NCGR_PEP_ID=MMETSP0447-20121125/6272_1 /TAXON_ID=0 /ORGANISM="Stygamoeba regulata, Strain BSH-02190019" /LENGTH=183 /DNA_ID=CAMNT_0019141967 /DNA_START=48 /DNA_END=599 /DNA_ORIENTATION=+